VSEPWEAEIFSVPDLSWQAQAPPARHAVPVRYVPALEPGEEVTIGLPGRCFIDGQVVTRTERGVTTLRGGTEQQEALAVAAPFAFWLNQAFPHVELVMQWWPVALSWIYRDAVNPGEQQPADEPPDPDVQAESWLDHVQEALDMPPVRQPRPAREAGALTGRTLRLQHERGAWSWWVAVSEPVDHDDDFVVHVMRPSEYWLAQAVFEATEEAHVVPLHRLYTYE
jgi:hypothetical protein